MAHETGRVVDVRLDDLVDEWSGALERYAERAGTGD